MEDEKHTALPLQVSNRRCWSTNNLHYVLHIVSPFHKNAQRCGKTKCTIAKYSIEKVSEYNLAFILIHNIVLSTVQRSFVDAENLARKSTSTEELVNSVVDVLIEGGDLVYIPGQLLVHLTTNPEANIY